MKQAEPLYKILLFILIAAFIFASPIWAAARLSGKIISYNSNQQLYTVELKDGSKVNIKLSSSKINRNSGSGSFRPGETAVFNITGALNDNPLIADSVMDVAYAKANASKVYVMPRNTPIGGTATIAGPVIMAGNKPNNVISSLGNGGNIPGDPTMPGQTFNNPMTVSSSAATSPVTGAVITNPNIQTPTGNLIDPQGSSGDFSQPPISPMTPSGASNMMSPQGQFTPDSPSLNLSVGPAGPRNSDPSSLITGNSRPATPQTMIYGDGSFGKNGGNAVGNASVMLGNDEEEDEEEDNPFSTQAQAGGVGSQIQVNAQLMKIDTQSNVIFYMVMGAQELGSAVISKQTVIKNGITGKTISISEIQPGSKAAISGLKRDESSVNAISITIMP